MQKDDLLNKNPILLIEVKEDKPNTKFQSDLKLGPQVYFWMEGEYIIHDSIDKLFKSFESFEKEQENANYDNLFDLFEKDSLKEIIMINFDESKKKKMLDDLKGNFVTPCYDKVQRITITTQYLLSKCKV